MKKVEVKSIEEARNKAVEWQNWASKQNLSYGELIEWQDYFSTLAKRFDLEDEFNENGII